LINSALLSKVGLVRLAAWHLPQGPVGPPARWAATPNVEANQTTHPPNRGRVGRKGRDRDKATKRRKGGWRKRKRGPRNH